MQHIFPIIKTTFSAITVTYLILTGFYLGIPLTYQLFGTLNIYNNKKLLKGRDKCKMIAKIPLWPLDVFIYDPTYYINISSLESSLTFKRYFDPE